MTHDTVVNQAPSHADWMALSRTEYMRLVAQLEQLRDEEWLVDTDCAGWRVREIVAHLVGAGEGNASVREYLRQARLGLAAKKGRDLVDGMNDVQVRERSGLGPAELVAALRDVGPRAVAGRTAYPRWLRSITVPFGPPVGTKPVGYLMGPIYTRDLWMHRVDIARATGRGLELTPEHDGRIVADVVAEWASMHGRPYRLELTGPAGGSFGDQAYDAVPTTLDAVEFLRGCAGRPDAPVLLDTRVTF